MCKMCQQPRQDIDSWLGLPDFSYSIQLIDFSIITFTRELVPFVVLFAFSHPVQSPSISPWSMQTTGLPGVTALSQPSQATLSGIWLSLATAGCINPLSRCSISLLEEWCIHSTSSVRYTSQNTPVNLFHWFFSFMFLSTNKNKLAVQKIRFLCTGCPKIYSSSSHELFMSPLHWKGLKW